MARRGYNLFRLRRGSAVTIWCAALALGLSLVSSAPAFAQQTKNEIVPDTMIGMSIASVVRLAGASAFDVLGVFAALTRYAVQLAAQKATDAEIASLRDSAEKLAVIDDTDSTIEDLRTFMRRLSEISHNALLISLCRLLADVQVEVAFELSGGRVAEWRRVAGGLHAARLAVVEALENRSAEQAADAIDAHFATAADLILSTPQAKKVQHSDPGYARLLVALLDTRLKSAAN